MASWNDLQARLRRDFKLDTDGVDELALTLKRQEAGTERSQRVMLRRYPAWGREMVEVRSAFGEVGEYDTALLLAENLNLPLGAIATHGRYLVLVQRVCIDDTTLDGMVFLMTRMSLLADSLEAKGGRDRF